ncbi:uncharacterized protein [Miscanthus floridulus]|uniref:uncharacterized protein n=1 Tax=Miscanthus floridulus TaxID=154761 RepID=UPI0034583FC8
MVAVLHLPLWLLGTVGTDVLGLAAAPDQTARELWVTIKHLFEANKAPRAIFLSHKFHSMTQGDSSIDEYCQQMKATADALHDVSRTITDPELVLNLLRGLNPRFASTTDNIADSHPLPDFATTCEKLVLKELCLANEGTVAAQTTFNATCGPACRSASPTASGGSSAGRQGGHGGGGYGGRSNSGGGGSRYRKKGRGGHDGGSGSQSAGGPRAPTPPAGSWFCYAPWTARAQ